MGVTDKATENTHFQCCRRKRLMKNADAESIASVKNSAVKAFSAQDRAVTTGDYESIGKKTLAAISDIEEERES